MESTGAAPAMLEELRRWVDPVLDAAGFTWNGSGQQAEDERLVSVLYEADPLDFVRRYPESGLQDSYGGQWPPPCVDLWLHFDWDARRVELDLEATDVVRDLEAAGHQAVAERATRLSGDADEDARMIAVALSLVLDVSGPGRP